MADRYEEIARKIREQHFLSIAAANTKAGLRSAYDLAEQAIAAALREQDTWYEIDDPEHPAPRDGNRSFLIGGMLKGTWRTEITRWLSAYPEATHWRPLPPPPQSVRQDASPSPDAGATPPSAGDGNG